MQCPHCDSDDVRWSESGNERMPWLLRLFRVAIRCNNCHRRFHVARWKYVPSAGGESEDKPAAEE